MNARQLANATHDYAAAGLPMPADRFHNLYVMSGFSYRDLAKILGMNGPNAHVHLREMSTGARKVPGPTGLALQAIAFGWRPCAELYDETDLVDRLADAIGDATDMDVTTADYARAALAEFRRYLGGQPWGEAVDWPPMADRLADMRYLEQADAHADEGKLGEAAARSILALALKYIRLVCPSPPSAAKAALDHYEKGRTNAVR